MAYATGGFMTKHTYIAAFDPNRRHMFFIGYSRHISKPRFLLTRKAAHQFGWRHLIAIDIDFWRFYGIFWFRWGRVKTYQEEQQVSENKRFLRHPDNKYGN